MSHLWRMFRTGLTILRKPLVVRTLPLHFQLEPATGCNLLCKTCQVPDYTPDQFKNMSLDQFRRAFDQIRPIKVALSGAGEPFLNPEMLDIIRYAANGGASKSSNYIIRLWARPSGQVFQLKHTSAISDTTGHQHKYFEPEVFAAGTDIELTCEITAGSVTAASIAGGFDIVLVDD